MDWKKLIAELVARGVTQQQIAALCGIVQSTVSAIGSGKTRYPSFEIGQKLIELHGASQRELLRRLAALEAKA